MELIELDATAQRALELLTNAGMSDGSIYDYTHTGFGSILRHFHTKGILYGSSILCKVWELGKGGLSGSSRTYPSAHDAAHTGDALIPIRDAHGTSFPISWPCTG